MFFRNHAYVYVSAISSTTFLIFSARLFCLANQQSCRQTGATGAQDVWPQKSVFEQTTYVHNHGLFSAHDHSMWGMFYAHPGLDPQRLSGVTSLEFTSCHYDGGYEAEGLASIISSMHFPLSLDHDDPDATINVTYDRTTFVDHGAVLFGTALTIQNWPTQSDQLRQVNVHMKDFTMESTHTTAPGDRTDGNYVWAAGLTSMLIERSRFENNGIFDDRSGGVGGIAPEWPESVVRPYSANFVGTEWVVR